MSTMPKQQQPHHVWVRHGMERREARILLPAPATRAAFLMKSNGEASSSVLLEDMVYVQYCASTKTNYSKQQVKEFVHRDRVEPMRPSLDWLDGGDSTVRPSRRVRDERSHDTVNNNSTSTTTTTTTSSTSSNNNDGDPANSAATAVAEETTTSKRMKTAASHTPGGAAAATVKVRTEWSDPGAPPPPLRRSSNSPAAVPSLLPLRRLEEQEPPLIVSSSAASSTSLSSSSPLLLPPPPPPQQEVQMANSFIPATAVGQKYLIGTEVEKYFNIGDEGDPAIIGARLFRGRVVHYDASEEWYLIRYEDGDEEELEERAVAELLATAETRRVPRAAPTWAVPRDSCLFALHGLDLAVVATKLVTWFGRRDCRTVAEFFLFVSERQRMYERRHRGDPSPWSACPALQNFSWCNVYRELDRGTAFFRERILNIRDEMAAVGRTATAFRDFVRRVLFCSYLYRQVNRIETFLAAGFPDEDSMEPFFATIEGMSAQGEPVFTGAHQTTNIATLKKRVGEETKIDSSTGKNKLDAVCDAILEADNDKRTIVRALRKLQGVGAFTSWQTLCDLQECRCIAVDDEKDGFCLLGPGAENGLREIFPASNKSNLELAQQLVKKHRQVYQKLGVEFPYWRGRPLTIKEIEHALCEFAKFKSIRRTNSGRSFRSRAALDANKICFACQIKCNGGALLCDTCQVCFCFNCTEAPAQDAVSWICHRCEAFEQGDIFNNSR